MTPEALAARLGPEAAAHVAYLDARFASPRPPAGPALGPASAGGRPDFDVLLLGGGLSLLVGTLLARAGWRVGVADRRRVGAEHREWNVSAPELAALARAGLFGEAELERLVRMRYHTGIVRWHGGGTYAVRGVLDAVVDSGGLMARLRQMAEAAGAVLWDGFALEGLASDAGRGTAWLAPAGGAPFPVTARLLLDATGATSPRAGADLVCPTVGGVLEGLALGDAPDEVDPAVGEILATTEGVSDGQQFLWEGFPQPGGRYTVYLFYYAERHRLEPGALASLYGRFFETLGRYKRGPARLVKPTYGYIPAHSRLRPRSASPRDRVLLLGDAAAAQSPLTFCGFGNLVRQAGPLAARLDAALREDRLDRSRLASAVKEPPVHGVTGALALMMSGGRLEPGADPMAVNRLLDAAFGALAAMGEPTFGAFVRDEIGARRFFAWLARIPRAHPEVFRESFARLGPQELLSWSRNAARFALSQPGDRPPGRARA